MQTPEAITITLLGIGAVSLFLVLVAVWRAGGSLLRIERLLSAQDAGDARARPPEPLPDLNGDGAFREFLAEDPARLKISKREQAETFRAWRKQRGMTWTGQ